MSKRRKITDPFKTARALPCPACGARPGESCVGARGAFVPPHESRLRDLDKAQKEESRPKAENRSMSRKTVIQQTIEDLVSNLFYYDRKEDEELPVGAIEDAVAKGEISKEEIVRVFQHQVGLRL